MTDLFIQQPTVKFERTKMSGLTVDENPNAWGRQVLGELYKQLPAVAEYTPTVMFMKVDEEQGYALGAVLISSSTDSALATSRVSRTARKALVPIVIKNHELTPMDLLLTSSGKMYPLSEWRLREALFRPETFEMMTEDHGDSSLWNMFYPPGRSDNSYGSGLSHSSGGGGGGVGHIYGAGMKMSAATGGTYELLEQIVGPSLIGADLDALVSKLAADDGLRNVAMSQPAMRGALEVLRQYEESASRDTGGLYKAAADMAGRSVIQLGFDAENGYWVKTASRSAFYHPEAEYMSRRDFLKFAGEAITHKVDTDGTVTIAPQSVADSNPDFDASKWGPVEEPGIYKVMTVAGDELVGWVLPNLLDVDGVRVPMAVFTNGAAASVQGQICGSRVAMGVDLPAGPAKGPGLFYVAGKGGVEGTVPLVVLGAEAGVDGGDSYHVRTFGGEESRVRLVPGLAAMQALGKEYMLPSHAKFLPLQKERMSPLVEGTDGLSKKASGGFVSIYGSEEGDEFDVRLEGLPKLASMYPRRLTHEQAMEVLCLGGLSSADASQKLAASTRALVRLGGLLDVKLASDMVAEARAKVASGSSAVRALRKDLVKEAAVLPDVMTVDTVLSLGFINSENVRMFASRIPYLEKSLSMLCELALASRLGLSEIPDTATVRAARGMDDAIQGLRALALRQVSGSDEKA
jgi:hypothetical protein